MAISDAYISYRQANMIIANGSTTKQDKLYPPAKPSIYVESHLWLDEEGDDPILHILTIDKYISFKEQE